MLAVAITGYPTRPLCRARRFWMEARKPREWEQERRFRVFEAQFQGVADGRITRRNDDSTHPYCTRALAIGVQSNLSDVGSQLENDELRR